MSDPRSLVVLGFDNQLAAQEMLTSLTRLSTEGTLLLQDAVFVTKADHGKVRVVQTTDRASAGAWSTSYADVTYGGAVDTWGRAFTPAEINDSGFGLAIAAVHSGGAPDSADIDRVDVSVAYTFVCN